MSDTLIINAHLKYVEFLLHTFDTGSDELTFGDIKSQFRNKFKILHPLLNQHFGIYRLLPLILIKEEYKNQDKKILGDIEKIKIIRDAVVHSKFLIDENGYTFENNKGNLVLSYNEFQAFLHKIENNFYSQNDKKSD